VPATLIALLLSTGAAAQENPPPPVQPPPPITSEPPTNEPHPGVIVEQQEPVDHWLPFEPEMATSREGSGTSWKPEATPLYGHMFMPGDWMIMLHYSLIAGYDIQWGPRGESRPLSTNWVMGMAQHPLLGGTLMLRAMLSGEPITAAGPDGTPELLQSGETYGGQPLHDKQHPHDFFMETALLYRHPIAGDVNFEFYGAPSGEPALGPTAFMHRATSMWNPFAPIGHHWQDSTHISFPVVTAGLFNQYVKVEGSVFHGREPDEDRWNMDIGRLDSWSYRLSVNPLDEFSLQASFGYINSPEAIDPSINEHRLTISAQYAGEHGALTAVWGRNIANHGRSDSFLVEGMLDVDRHSIAFARGEWVQKSAADLDVLGNAVYNVSQLVIGYAYQPWESLLPIVPYFGVAVDVGFTPISLIPIYETQNPTGVYFFLGFHPPRLPPMTGMKM
jgi:hypothetical protein